MMTRAIRTAAITASIAFTALALLAQSAPKPAENSAGITRGKYLVERVSTCQDCHSPRDQHGRFIREQWLQGSALFFRPTVPIPGWAGAAPPIAGLKGWGDEDAIKFLMTGKKPGGNTARPPMPEFRFNRKDAEAIVLYLKSLSKTETAEAK